MKYSQPYKDAVRIQRRIMEVLDAVATKDLANVAKGYCTLETLKLRLRMKGPPKAVDAVKEDKHRKPRVAVPSED